MTDWTTIRVETHGRVGLIVLDRPEVLNALNSTLMHEIVTAARHFDADEGIGAIVVAGSEKAFAAGADISEMAELSALDLTMRRPFEEWSAFADVRTPVVAAVRGYALGGGCELALMCDVIVAGEGARFGQPEVNLGVIPGLGGTQRLVRAIGYYKAADLVLTGRMMDAHEAERCGLVSRVVADDAVLDEAMALADGIAARSLPSLYGAKAALDAALETTLAEGLKVEHQVFASLFATEDQKEGMAAFLEKRSARFQNR